MRAILVFDFRKLKERYVIVNQFVHK